MKKLLLSVWLCLVLPFVELVQAAPGLYWADVSTTLTVRAQPSTQGAVIGALRAKEQVRVMADASELMTIGGRQGRWVEISYQGQKAYVFDGFLKPVSNGGAVPEQPAVSHADTLAKLKAVYPGYYANGVFIIDVSDQRLYVYRDGALVGQHLVSTAAKGTGNVANSQKTPLGVHRIRTKIGGGKPRGTIFEKMQSTGRVAHIYTGPSNATALVTSRIMRLDGLEPGINQGGNVDTFNRAIYIHGTNKEGYLGRPASHGCIRMANDEVIALYDQTSVDTLVLVQK